MAKSFLALTLSEQLSTALYRYRVKPKFHYTDTDQTRPDLTRPDILRPGLRQVWSISNSTIRARPDRRRQIGDLSRDVARPINPTSFNKMENVTMSVAKNIVAACTAAIASSLGAASLLAIGRKRRHSTWEKKSPWQRTVWRM